RNAARIRLLGPSSTKVPSLKRPSVNPVSVVAIASVTGEEDGLGLRDQNRPTPMAIANVAATAVTGQVGRILRASRAEDARRSARRMRASAEGRSGTGADISSRANRSRP